MKTKGKVVILVFGLSAAILGMINCNSGSSGTSEPSGLSAKSYFCVSQPDFNPLVANAISGDYWEWFMSKMEDVGAKTTRIAGPILAWSLVEPVIGEGYDFTLADQFINHMAKGSKAIDIVMTIKPTRDKQGGSPTGAHREAYIGFLKAVFNRYAPEGLAPYNQELPVRYFQIGNELQNVPPPDVYLDILVATAEAVRGVGAKVRILTVAGASNDNNYYPTLIRGIADRQLGDIVAGIDLHTWGETDLHDFLSTISHYKDLLKNAGLEQIEIWSLENGTYYGCPDQRRGETPSTLSERDQAVFLVKTMTQSQLAGLHTFCWNNLVDWVAFAGDPNSIFSAMGLIGDGSGNSCEDPNRVAAPRIAYYTFKRLAENLDSEDIELMGAINLGPGADGAGGVVYRNRLTGRKIYVVYTNDGARSEVSFPISSTRLRVIPLITDTNGDAQGFNTEFTNQIAMLEVDGALLGIELQ